MSVEQHHRRAPKHLQVAVLTVSDTRDPDTDESGKLVRELLEEHGHGVAHYEVVKDERAAIQAAVERGLGKAQAVLLNGGTGVSPRDVTIEALRPMLDKELPGFGELLRDLSFREIGSAAMLTRALAGLVKGKPVFAMPGSPDAVVLAMRRLVLPELGHVAGEAVKGTGKEGDPLAKRHQ